MDIAYPKRAALSATKPLALLGYGIGEARILIIPARRQSSRDR
jgi:hypothetical protein